MKIQLPFNPKKEIFTWGPVVANYYSISELEEIFFSFPGKYKGNYWPKSLVLIQGKNILWLNDFSELRQQGKKVFMEIMFRKSIREKVYLKWKQSVNGLENFEKEIDKLKLTSLGREEFVFVLKKFNDLMKEFWGHGLVPELANYGSDDLLINELSKYVKDKNDLTRVMEILTAPEQLSFYRAEEVNLFKSRNLDKHTKKYFWLQNSYSSTRILNNNFFKKRKAKLSLNLLSEINNFKKDTINKKKFLINKYKLPLRIVKFAEALVRGIEWQDERKGQIFKYLYYKKIFIEESSRRLKLNKDDLLNFGTREIIKLFSTTYDISQIKERQSGFGAIIRKNKIIFINTELAKKYWKIFTEIDIKKDIKDFSGIPTSYGCGIVSGRVRIIIDSNEKNKFKPGEILVAAMTTPEYIFIMKKSAAIITDTGGITSHAAIVSRELKVPCIVGTKIATKVLRDGDMVEVDADKGIVKILKSK